MNSVKKFDKFSINPIFGIVGLSTLVLFFFSSLRHALFQSGAGDLGIFDQGVYLISQGVSPNSSLINLISIAPSRLSKSQRKESYV